MIGKKTIILLAVLFFSSLISIAKAPPHVFTIQEIGKTISRCVVSTTFQGQKEVRWLNTDKALKASNTPETTYLFPGTHQQFIHINDNGKDAERNLIALHFALGLQVINSQNIKLPKIKILILQPLRKMFAIGLVLLLSVVIAITLIANNVAQKQLTSKLSDYERRHELEMERQHVSGEMYHLIIADLTCIVRISEAINNPGLNKEISDAGNKLINSINELAWCLHPDHDSLHVFFTYLRQSLQQLNYSSRITCNILLPENTGDITLSIVQRRNMLLMIKEIVYNAIKHSSAAEIIVKAVVMDKGLQFFVSDNGIGFDINQPINGSGIKNINKQANDINGRLTLTSEAGSGTYFTIFIPLKS